MKATKNGSATTKNGNGTVNRITEAVATSRSVTISPPKFQVAEFCIRGVSAYVQHKFSHKALLAMREAQEAGSTGKKGKKRDPKDFAACYEGSMHLSTDDWFGIPAPAFRAASISACKAAGFAMTRAKLSLFVEADGVGLDGTPLVRITKGEPHPCEHLVRIQQTTDIRVRAMWDPGWEAKVRVRFDADQFTLTDVANLLMRVGCQVGIGEGRPDSRTSCGMGWGLFDLLQ